MNENYMPKVVKMLGIQIDEPFDVIIKNGIASPCGPFYFDENWKIRDNNDGIVPYWFLEKILIGEYTLQKRPWRPKDREGYWYITCNKDIYWDYFRTNNLCDLAFLNMGNCFPTKETAEAAVPEMLEKFEEIKKGETCHIEDECCCKKEKMTECKMEYEDMMNALEKAARSSNVLSGNDEQQVLEFISELRYSEAGWGVWDDID